MAVVGVELETLVSELDALTIRPPPNASLLFNSQITCHFWFIKNSCVTGFQKFKNKI